FAIGLGTHDDGAPDAEPRLERAVVGDAGIGWQRGAVRMLGVARGVEMHVAVAGVRGSLELGRTPGKRPRHADVLPKRSSVDRLTEIPSPGPSGMRTVPFSCSMGVVRIAWRNGCSVRSNSSNGSDGGPRGTPCCGTRRDRG